MSLTLAEKRSKLREIKGLEEKVLGELMANPSFSVVEASKRLHITPGYVRTLLTSVYKKLEVPPDERDKRGYVFEEYGEAYREEFLKVEILSLTPPDEPEDLVIVSEPLPEPEIVKPPEREETDSERANRLFGNKQDTFLKPNEAPVTPPVTTSEPVITVTPPPARVGQRIPGGVWIVGALIIIAVIIAAIASSQSPSQPAYVPQQQPQDVPSQSTGIDYSPPAGVYDSNETVYLNGGYVVNIYGYMERGCNDAGSSFEIVWTFGNSSSSDFELNLNNLSFSLTDDQGRSYSLKRSAINLYQHPEGLNTKTIQSGLGTEVSTCWATPAPSSQGASYIYLTIRGLPGGKEIVFRKLV